MRPSCVPTLPHDNSGTSDAVYKLAFCSPFSLRKVLQSDGRSDSCSRTSRGYQFPHNHGNSVKGTAVPGMCTHRGPGRLGPSASCGLLGTGRPAPRGHPSAAGTHVQRLQAVPAEGVLAALAHHLGAALVPLDVHLALGAAFDGRVVLLQPGPRTVGRSGVRAPSAGPGGGRSVGCAGGRSSPRGTEVAC